MVHGIANSPASRFQVPFPLSRKLFWARERRSTGKQTCGCSVKGCLPCVHCYAKYKFQSNTHVSKKRRLSATHINTPGPANSCTNWESRFGIKSSFCKDQQRTSRSMGNAKSIYEEAKSKVLETLSLLKKRHGALNVKSEADEEIEISDDSSVEVIEITEDGPEDGSVISHQGLQGTDGFAYDLKNLGSKSKMVDAGVIPASHTVLSDMNDGEEPARMINSLSLSSTCHTVHVPACKNLLERACRSDSRLRRFQSDISIQEDIWQSLIPPRLTKEHNDEKSKYLVLLKEPFVPLTKAEQNAVTKALSNANWQKILVTHEDSNIEITGQVLQCLRAGAWLNDEVINLYLELLKERERRDPKKFLRCHFFNTFFYKRLTGGRTGYDYKSVSRWTSQKKLGYGLIECDKIFVPIHQGFHWCLAVINRKDKKFQYLDSLGGRDPRVLKVLAQYFVDEVKDKIGHDIDLSSWEFEFVNDHPAQKNRSDCGVFMIKYIDFYSRGLRLDFFQGNMPYFRMRTAKEILQLKAN